MYLTLSNLLPYLLDHGHLVREDLTARDIAIQEVGRRNRNFKLRRRGGGGLFIKQASFIHPELTEAIKREAIVHHLAQHHPALAGLTAMMVPLHRHDTRRHVLVCDLLDDHLSPLDYRHKTGTMPPGFAAALGARLALLHRLGEGLIGDPAASLFARKRHWLFTMIRAPEQAAAQMGTGAVTMGAALAARPALLAALDAMNAAWSVTTLIHGDVKWDNLLVPDEIHPDAPVRLVDWELADLGDPAWDVAFGLVGWLIDWIYKQGPEIPLPSLLATGQATLIATHGAVRDFWAHYRGARGWDDETAAQFLARVLAFAAARLVLLGYEVLPRLTPGQTQMATLPHAQIYADLALLCAERLVADRADTARLLFGIDDIATIDDRAEPTAPVTAQDETAPPRQTDASSPLPTGALRRRLETLIGAIGITAIGGFTLGDTPLLETGIRLDAATLPRLINPLGDLLYWQGYATVYAGGPPIAASHHTEGDAGLRAALAAAYRTDLCWNVGWRIYQVDPDGTLHVRKRGLYQKVTPGQFRQDADRDADRDAAVGDRVAIQVTTARFDLQPGFYHFFSRTPVSDFDQVEISRCYFHTRADHAPALLGWITARLTAFDIPFQLKCASNPDDYHRTDAIVLYLARRYLQALILILETGAEALAPWLCAGEPLFTKTLMPGIGLADDPGNGESFGQSRCRLLAEALLTEALAGRHATADRLKAAADFFQRAGLSLAAPYVQAPLTNRYDMADAQP